jgi:2-polyprenyl-3-methyl-5-hydroxy-6-metoxy-1,4-benzoquinol methylase
MGTKIITQSEMQKRKFLAPVINQSATQRDVQSFLNKNNAAAKFTLNFFDEYIKRCDQQNTKFRLDGGLKKYLRRWQYYWTVKNTPVKSGSLILDAGCGGSLFPFFLSSFYKSDVIGIDFGNEEIKMSENLKKIFPELKVKFIKADMVDFQYEKKFDAIFSISVIEHIERWLDALVNLGGLLTGNGFLSFTFDYRKWRNRKSRGYMFTQEEINIIINELKKHDVLLRGNDFVDRTSLTKHLIKRRYYTAGVAFFKKS